MTLHFFLIFYITNSSFYLFFQKNIFSFFIHPHTNNSDNLTSDVKEILCITDYKRDERKETKGTTKSRDSLRWDNSQCVHHANDIKHFDLATPHSMLHFSLSLCSSCVKFRCWVMRLLTVVRERHSHRFSRA